MVSWRRLLLALVVTTPHLGPGLGLCESSQSIDASRPDVAATPGIETYDLVYASDYFSFLGSDQEGRVAFALDSNRGRDGGDWQAEHFVVLHEEGRGWIGIEGGGPYPNEVKALVEIPDSAAFQFQGTSRYGYVIGSPPNGLTLRVGAISEHLSRTQDAAVYRMGSAPAVLAWRGRVLEGRVIHEHLLVPDYNRLSRVYIGTWNDFQGFYVFVEEGGDLYLHSQKDGRLSTLVGELDGFLSIDGRVERLDDASVAVLGRELALGAYRWPTHWRIEWPGSGENGPRVIELTLSDHQVMSNWVLGGFAMGIVTGTLTDQAGTQRLYGLAELLM